MLPIIEIWLLLFCLFPLSCQDDSVLNNKIKAGIMLVRLTPKTEEQLNFLKALHYSKKGLKLQLWRHPDKLDRHVDIWIKKNSYAKFETDCKQVAMEYEIVLKNIYNETGTDISMSNIELFDDSYQQYQQIVSELKRIAVAYSHIASIEILGQSYEKKDIYAIKVHSNTSSLNEEKPVIFINCGTHSREWLGIAACKYAIRKIIFNYHYDSGFQDMLSKFDLIVIPLLNPDGYVFSHESRRYRLWRKSRSPTSESHCFGVDLNRNFEYRWGGGGSSRDPCEEIYCGTKPFSEKESLILARYLYKIRRRLKAYLDVHTFGQLWMSPWGYTKVYPKDYKKQEDAMKEIQKAVNEQKGGVRYKIGRSSSTLYQTSGDALDWVYGRLGITYTFGLELRPSFGVRRGFRYTKQAIKPTGRDLLTGLTTLAQVIARESNTKS